MSPKSVESVGEKKITPRKIGESLLPAIAGVVAYKLMEQTILGPLAQFPLAAGVLGSTWFLMRNAMGSPGDQNRSSLRR